ncbi:MAG: hypothetical protein J3R72DRAFT_492322 [Linnemannia gamsii]|nr:MAG: hypothetical protein J3R72DRAFT_492322 [Linnemannia gamsii]
MSLFKRSKKNKIASDALTPVQSPRASMQSSRTRSAGPFTGDDLREHLPQDSPQDHRNTHRKTPVVHLEDMQLKKVAVALLFSLGLMQVASLLYDAASTFIKMQLTIKQLSKAKADTTWCAWEALRDNETFDHCGLTLDEACGIIKPHVCPARGCRQPGAPGPESDI